MAATLSSTGTWTTLTTDLTVHTEGNVPTIKNEAYGDFASPIPEVGQMVQLLADGCSCTYWQAASFLRQQLTSLMNGAVPKVV